MAYFVFTLLVVIILNLDRVNHKVSEAKLNIIILFSLIFIFIVFSGFRFQIGYDYNNYDLWINELPKHPLGRMIREPLNFLMMSISHWIFKNQFYFLINAFITITLIFMTIFRNSKNWKLSIWIFFMFPMFYLNSMSIVRFFTALSISFYSLRFIQTRDIKKYFILMLVATMFHNSALLSIPIYFLYENKFGKKTIILFVIAIFSILPFLRIIVMNFFPRYAYIFTGDSPIAGNKTILVILAILILSVFFMNKIFKDKLAKFYFTTLVFGMIINLVFYKYNTLGYRGSLYYYIYLVMYVPSLIDIIGTKYKHRINIATYILMLPMLFYMIYVGGSDYSPYKFRFELIHISPNYYQEIESQRVVYEC